MPVILYPDIVSVIDVVGFARAWGDSLKGLGNKEICSREEQCSLGAYTYKPPTEKRNVNSSFVLLGICSPHKCGSGASRRIKSVRALTELITLNVVGRSMHFDGTRGFHAPLTGWHWKTAVRIVANEVAMKILPMRYRSQRNLCKEKIRL